MSKPVTQPKAVSLRLNQIAIDDDIQPRVKGLDQKHVDELADAIREGKKLPPVVVYDVGDANLLSEGFHRLAAYTLLKKTHIPCEVRTGTREECKLNALASNQSHGLKRTNADKLRALEETLKIIADYKPKWSDGKVAEYIGVSRKFVSENRPQVGTVPTSEPEKREGKDGKVYPAARPNPKPEQPVTASEPGPTAPPTVAPTAPEPVIERPSDPTGDSERKATTPTPAEPKPKAAKKSDPTVIPPPAVDAWGIPVQPHAAEAFESVPLFAELIATLTRAQRQYSQLALTPGGVFLHKKSVFLRGEKQEDGTHKDRIVHAGIDDAIKALKVSRPTHTVCPWHYVEGPHPDDCHTCRGMNWTPELGKQIPQSAIDKAKEAHGV